MTGKKGPPCFYITCGNAAFNRGDRGNLLSQITLLRQHFPNARIIVESYRARVDRHWYDAEFVPVRFTTLLRKRQRQLMREADVIIWGGGALIADNSCRTLVPYWCLKIALIKFITRKPVMAWAHGVVLKTTLGKFFGRIALRMADLITVRDENSLNAVRALCLKQPVHLTGDPAILIRIPNSDASGAILNRELVPPSRKLILFSPTFWHFQHDSEFLLPYPIAKNFSLRWKKRRTDCLEFSAHIGEFLKLLASRTDAHILVLPRYPSLLWDDIPMLEESITSSAPSGRMHLLRHDDYPTEDYLSLWKEATLSISIALHDSMFALALGTPALHLHYEAKGVDLFKDAGLEDALISWEKIATPDGRRHIAECALRLMENGAERTLRQNAGIIPLRERALENMNHLKALLAQRGIRTS